MSFPAYTPGYPPDGFSLGNTKTQIRNNLDGTYNTLDVDHQNTSEPNPGYHAIIHGQNQTTASTVAGINQVLMGIPGTLIVNGVTTPAIPSNGDTQLYALTGMGGLSQLTGNSAATNGFQWIGGILIQWGYVFGTHSGSSQLFNAGDEANLLFATANYNFPTACLGVWTQLMYRTTPAGDATAQVQIGLDSNNAINKLQFHWKISYSQGFATNYWNRFFWVAIGY
jgi:hypothetical protein